MTIFISGGCKNGKSSIAENCCTALSNGGPLYYIATMQAFDDEDRERIKRHRASRAGKGFETIEQPLHILDCLKSSDPKNGTYILDSVTALMINELYSNTGAMGEDTYDLTSDPKAAKRVASELTELCRSVKNIVFVSDYIYSGIDAYSEYTEDYLKALSFVDKALAKECDAVAEVCIGNINMLKGELPL